MKAQYTRVRDLTEVAALHPEFKILDTVNPLLDNPKFKVWKGVYFIVFDIGGSRQDIFVEDCRCSKLFLTTQEVLNSSTVGSIKDDLSELLLSLSDTNQFIEHCPNRTVGNGISIRISPLLNALRLKASGALADIDSDPTLVIIDLHYRREPTVFLFSVLTWFNGGSERFPVPVYYSKEELAASPTHVRLNVLNISHDVRPSDVLVIYKAHENPFDPWTRPFAVCSVKKQGSFVYVTSVDFSPHYDQSPIGARDKLQLLENLVRNNNGLTFCYDKSLFRSSFTADTI